MWANCTSSFIIGKDVRKHLQFHEMKEKFNYVVNNCQELWRFFFEKVISVSWNEQTNGLKKCNSCSTLGLYLISLKTQPVARHTHTHTRVLTRTDAFLNFSLVSPDGQHACMRWLRRDSFAFLSREGGSLRNFAEVRHLVGALHDTRCVTLCDSAQGVTQLAHGCGPVLLHCCCG